MLQLLALMVVSGCTNEAKLPEPSAVVAGSAPEVVSALVPASGVTLEGGALVLNTAKGPMKVFPVYHSTTRIEAGGLVIWLDPWSKAALDGAAKADVVLITDTHFDHLDKDALAKVVKEGTVFVAPQTVKDGLPEYVVNHVLANGAEVAIGDLTVKAVPMYNLVRGPAEGGVYHEKGRGNGYVLMYGGKSVYFAGDTECTDEMKAQVGMDLAFLPMNLPYTMTTDEAAACVNVFRPAVVVPYHYAGSDLASFKAGVTAPGVRVEIVEYYPGGLPW